MMSSKLLPPPGVLYLPQLMISWRLSPGFRHLWQLSKTCAPSVQANSAACGSGLRESDAQASSMRSPGLLRDKDID